jgi:type I restriction enzyme S subunit
MGNKFESISAGSTFKAIRKNDLDRLEILLPPLPEQKKIAEILTTVDQGIEKVDEAIKKTQRLKNGLMQELLTKGIGHKEFKDTEIGKVPKEWEVVRLSNVFKLASGKSRPKEISDKQTDKMPIPVYGGNGVLGYTNKFMVDNETVVIGRVGEYCGSIHKTLKSSWITDNALYAAVIEKCQISLDFFTYYLVFINLNKFKKESGQPLMTQTIIYSISCPLPSLPEQQKIAEILSTVDERLDLFSKRKERLERTKKGLMNDLLTGKKRVQLEV